MNILIVGLGSIAQKHIAAIQETITDHKIYALRSKGSVNVFPDIQNIYTFGEMDVTPDFIIISNPTYLHAETIKHTVSIGCPLFIEKPVVHDVNDLVSLGDLIRQHETITYVACNMRFHPVIQYLKNYLNQSEERINEVNIYCGSFLPDWRPGRDFREVYSSKSRMGGGVHLDLIHELDYCCWLFCEPEKITSVKRNVSSLHIDAVDFAHYHLLYDKFTANITLNYYRKDARRELEIVTEHDTLKADLLSCSVMSLETGGVLFKQKFNMKETYLNQMRYFVECLKNKQKPMNDFYEATLILKMALE